MAETAAEQRRAHTVDAARDRLEGLLAEEQERVASEAEEAEQQTATQRRPRVRDPEPDETETAEVEDTEDAGETLEADEAETTDAEETEEVEEADVYELTTLAQLAEDLEIPVDDVLATLTHNETPLSDFVTNHDARTNWQEQNDAYRTIAEARQGEIDEYTKQSNMLAQLYGGMVKNLSDSLQDPTLTALRTSNPGEWAARTQDINNQIQGLQMTMQQLGQQYDEYMTTKRDEFFASERQILATQVPEWGEPKLQSAVDTIKSLGFSDTEVQHMGDHRLIKAALELTELRAFKAETEAAAATTAKAVKKVKRTVPKTLKPGARKGAPTATRKRASNVTKLKQRLAKRAQDQRAGKRVAGSDVQSAADVLRSMMD